MIKRGLITIVCFFGIHTYAGITEAIRQGDVAQTKVYLKHGISPNFHIEEGDTPLHIAARYGYFNIVHILLSHNASPHARNIRGETPLHIATYYAHTMIIDLLLRQNIDIHAQDTFGDTPLHIATRRGFTYIVATLLANDACPDIKNALEDTPLYIATYHGYQDIIYTLLHYDADINTQNNRHKCETVLHQAGENKDQYIMALLLRYNPIIDSRDIYGETPLFKVLDTPEHTHMLLAYQANPNARNLSKQAPIHWATAYRNHAVLHLLFTYGAYPNVQDTRGRTPLHIATHFRYISTVQYLTKHNAQINTPDIYGETPLHFTLRDPEAVKELLRMHANPNVQNTRLQTPLHKATVNRYTGTIQTLIAHKASPYIYDDQGQTPIDIAHKTGNHTIETILCKGLTNKKTHI